MIGMVKLTALVSISYLAFLTVFSVIRPVSSKRQKNTRDFLKKAKNQQNKEKFYYFRDVVLRKLASKSLLSELKRDEYRSLIQRLDLRLTPEELRAQQILLALLACIAALIVLKINPLMGCFSFLGPIVAWMYPVDELERKVSKKDKNIMLDFPSFYSMLYYQYSRSVDIYLADVVRDYLPNANSDMYEELGILLDNIEYGEEHALKQLKKRVPLRYIIKFCDIMQTRLNGYDNVSQMAYLKNELHESRIRTLEEELKDRQNKNLRVQFSLIIVLAVYVITYFYFQFMDAIKIFS